MANSAPTTPASPDTHRERVIQRARLEAASRHDRCDALDLQAGTSDVSGDELVYCGRCGQLLLRWGGDDAE
ncbi:hypothetical protein [Halorubrum trueperi]|uniref:Small CPxCG-related zinc finger protein n=1 Tax=Halorubrum trueperi TaxID=2004704 RepID=A0ABD5ULX6_9EURY